MAKIKILEPRFYIPNFLKIRTKSADLVPFILKPAQERLLGIIEGLRAQRLPVRIIILKARQLGFSTLVEALICNDESTNSLKNGMIVAHEDAASQNLYQMYKTFYDNLPPELTPMRKYSNAQEMLFENPTNDIDEKRRNPGLQSKISVVTARNVDAGRSQTIHNLHASEVAFWRDAKTLMTGLLQAIPDTPNTNVYIESTANGVGGWFYDTWRAAEKGENGFIPLFFPWFDEPDYSRPFRTEEERQDFIDKVEHVYYKELKEIHTEEWELKHEHGLTYEQLNWRDHTTKDKCSGDDDMFCQEYPSTPEEAFIVSGRPKFNVSSLREYKKRCIKGERGNIEFKGETPVFISDPKGYIEIWQKPEEGKFYCIGADVAEGLIHGDYSVAMVGDEDFNTVAAWHGHIDPDLYGKELVKLARYYNEAYIGCESNNHGLTTLKAIQNVEYYNVYYMKKYDKISDVITQKMGWETNPRTKPMMIDKLAEYIRERWIGIKWEELINQCLTYMIDDKGSTNAISGEYDDAVIACAILLQMLLEGKGENYVPESSDGTVTKKKRGFMVKDDEEDRDTDSDEALEISR